MGPILLYLLMMVGLSKLIETRVLDREFDTVKREVSSGLSV